MKIAAPRRARHRYVQRLVAPPSVVLPLLCPVREAEWLEDWDPVEVWTESGFAEPDCVFTTAASPHDAIWYVTRVEPESGFVEMVKITPGTTACRLTIRLRATDSGCDAEVTYTHTSLGPAGDRFVDGFTAEFYLGFMREWERRLNHFLATGTRLEEA